MTRLLDFPSDNLRNQLLHEILQSAGRSLLTHNLHHPFTNLPNLGSLCISCLLDLIWSTFCECNDENSKEISIGCFDIGMGFD
jgi:hypothetical protein